MQYFYSFANAGFYTPSLNSLPDDAVELADGDYIKLLNGLEKMMKIVNVDGYPTLVDIPPPSALEKSTGEFNIRRVIASEQIAILQPAVDAGYAKPEHTQLLADWQRYRYELTQVPERSGWPETPQWPTEPEKII
ncbi:tail fiber assembly protein [Aeromonas salmonicida]